MLLPLLFLFALGISAVLATACILFPQPKHLSRNVFFGTMGFILGGALGFLICLFTLDIAFPGVMNQPPNTGTYVIEGILFVLFGGSSAWVTLKIVNSFLESWSRAGK